MSKSLKKLLPVIIIASSIFIVGILYIVYLFYKLNFQMNQAQIQEQKEQAIQNVRANCVTLAQKQASEIGEIELRQTLQDCLNTGYCTQSIQDKYRQKISQHAFKTEDYDMLYSQCLQSNGL